MRHKLLARQLRRTLGVTSEKELQGRLDALRAQGQGDFADGVLALLDATEHSYEQFERDLQVRTRMLDISSEELMSANAQLREEAARQREVLRSLQASVQRLTFDASSAAPPPPSDFDNDLLRLTQALEQLVQQRETARELTEQILDQLPIPVFLKDREGRFVRFNRQFEQFSKRTRAEMLGFKIEDFASAGWAGVTQEEDALAWRTGRVVTTERRLVHIDPPIDLVVKRIVITSGGESYLLGFSIDVSEQRAARDAMQRAVESAQAASRAKSEFLANMSHEIRTPMNGILGMTELVLESPLEPEQRDDLALVKASADSLLTIINDILDFSKIEAGKLDIEEVPFDLRKLVRETVRSMALRAQQKGLALRCELPPDLPRTLKGDPGRLRQVLINLLGNAIKFTQTGSVTLSLSKGREQDDLVDIAFAVSDTGIGIPPDKQKLIFEAFSQVDGSTTRQYGGTGLGLTICRRLVILMHGDIGVRSEPGVGSTFHFRVPLRHSAVLLQAPLPQAWLAGKGVLLVDSDDQARAARCAALSDAGMHVTECASLAEARKLQMGERVALVIAPSNIAGLDGYESARAPAWPPLVLADPQAAAQPALNDTLLEQVLDVLSSQGIALAPPLAAAAPVPQPGAPAAADGLHLLLAEDNPVNQRLALRLLEKMGHRVTLVDNGLDAAERGMHGDFDLILMDVQMPELDGLSATRQIRQWELGHGGHVPIVAMTARAMQGDRERCIEAGMDDYLSKPVDHERLRQVVGRFHGTHAGQVLAWRSALLRLDGDTGLLLELAALFLEDGPQLLRTLYEALDADDLPGSQRAVHSLQGVLVNFGAQRAIGLAERMTASLHDPAQAGQWRSQAEALGAAIEDVYVALRELIDAGPAGL